MKGLVKEGLEALHKTFSAGQIALESSQAALSQLSADYHSARRAIQETSSALRNVISTREAELLKQADAKRAELAKKLAQSAAGLEPATAQAQAVISEARKEVKGKDGGNADAVALLRGYSELVARMDSAGAALRQVLEAPPARHPLPRFRHGGLMAYVPSCDGRQILASLRAFGAVSVDSDLKAGEGAADGSLGSIDLFVPSDPCTSPLQPPPPQKRRANDDIPGITGEHEKEGGVTELDDDSIILLSPIIKTKKINTNNNTNNSVDMNVNGEEEDDDDEDMEIANSLPLVQPKRQKQSKKSISTPSKTTGAQISSGSASTASALCRGVYSSEYIQRAEERLVRFGGQIDAMVDKLKQWMSARVFTPVAQGLNEMASKCTSKPSSPAYPVEFAKTVQSWRPGLWLYLNVPGRSASDVLYVAERIRLFARGVFVQESLAGRIADAQIIEHGFATFFDLLAKSNGSGERPFTERFVVRAPENPEDGSRDRVVIYQRCIDPPHFEVYWKGKCCEVPPGIKNVFYALFIFVYAVHTKLGGSLGTVSLSSPAVDLLNVLKI